MRAEQQIRKSALFVLVLCLACASLTLDRVVTDVCLPTRHFSMPRTTTSARHRHETLSERLRGGARGAGVVALSLCNIGASPLIDAQCRTAGVVLLLTMTDDGTRHHHEAFT